MSRNIAHLFCVFGFLIVATFSATSLVLAVDEYVFPTEHTTNSPYVVYYGDLDTALDTLVFNVGRSEHKHAAPQVGQTGTRFKFANNKSSWLESNRIAYSLVTDKTIAQLGAIKERLESVSEDVALERFSKDEQLAYWLNLHNITVIHVLAQHYPVSNIKRLYEHETCSSSKGCRNKKASLSSVKINIGEHVTSLDAIREHIVSNWSDPLVIYGFYMGYIGGPNIRQSAYTGKNIWRQLADNAAEFMNSIRGTQIWDDTLKVSEHYQYARGFFTDFDLGMKQHFAQYAGSRLKNWLGSDPKVEVSVDNWGINDFNNGRAIRFSRPRDRTNYTNRGLLNGDQNKGSADLRFSNASKELFTALRDKFQRQSKDQNPSVEIDELDRGKVKSPESEDKKNN